MKNKKIKKKLAFLLTLASTATLLSCSTSELNQEQKGNKENSQEFKEIEKYFSDNDSSIFSTIKETVLKDYFSQSFNKKDFNSSLISFLSYYKKIFDLKVENSIINDLKINEFNKEEISQKLLSYDKIVNTNFLIFKNVNEILVKDIEDTYVKLLENNKALKLVNDNYVDFINLIIDSEVNASLFSTYLKNNFIEIINFNKKDETLKNIISLNKNLLFINDLFLEFKNHINKLNTEKEEFEILKASIVKENDLTSLIAKAEKIKKSILDKIKENNLVSEGISKEKEKLLNEIENDSFLSEEEKNNFKEKLNNINSSTEIKEFIKELDNFKNDLKNKINEIINDESYLNIFSKEDYEIFKFYLHTIDTKEKLTDFKNNLTLLKEKITLLKNKIQEIENNINNNSLKPETALEYYKNKVKVDYLLKDEKIKLNNLSNLSVFNENIDNILEEINLVINNDSSISASGKTLIDLFREEATANLTYNLKENLDHFDLNNYLYSASINDKNNKMYLNDGDTETIDYEIKNISLKSENINVLNLIIKASLKSNPNIFVELQKELSGFNPNNDTNSVLNSINPLDIDEIFNVDYNKINLYSESEFSSLSIDELSEIFSKKTEGIGRFFTYKIANFIELSDQKVKLNISIEHNGNSVKNIQLLTKNVVTFRPENKTKEEIKDELDLAETLKIINGDIKLFLSALKFKKDSLKNHSYYMAKEAIKAFENEYIMPKFGKYEVYIKNIATFDNNNGYVFARLSYKENGEIKPNAPTSSQKVIYNFRKINFEDINPINNKYFQEEDFINKDTQQIPAEDVEIFNNLTEANFSYRLAAGKTYNADDFIKYRSLNIKNFIEQEAFRKFEYFITLSAASNKKANNLDNEDFLDLNVGIYDKDIVIQDDSAAITKIKNNYFVYAFDFKLIGRRGLEFKLGFINKKNPNLRYKLDKTFSLINLVNDYEQALYPEVMLNNIKYSDLSIDQSALSSKRAFEFKNDLESLNSAITLKTNDEYLEYKGFKLNKNNFKIIDIKKIKNDEAYIRFGTFKYDYSLNKDKTIKREKVEIKGSNWYKISGFALAEINENNPNENLDFNNSNLETTFENSTTIKRKRVIEQYWKDLTWTLNEESNVASWLFDKKYIEKTLLNNSFNRKLNFHIYGYRFINDFRKNARINSKIDGINFTVNFDELLEKGTLIEEFTIPRTTLKNNSIPEVKIKAIFNWNEEKGIKVALVILGNSNKIVISQPESLTFAENEVFKPEQAFVMLPAGAKVSLEYSNSIEEEEFIETNKFNYNDVDYNQLNQPILFSNNIDQILNREVYFPNQNVPFKLNNGYLMDLDPIRFKTQRENKFVSGIWNRTMRYTQGTATMIGKVNDDPNDGRFYFLTNHHVQGMDDQINNWSDYSGDNFLKEYTNKNSKTKFKYYLTVPYEYIRNNINPGPSTDGAGWGINYVSDTEKNPGFEVSTTFVWTGQKQLDKKTGTNEINADLTIVIWDVKPIIKALKERGMMHAAKHLENWFNLKKLSFNWEASKYSFIPGPHTKDIAHIGFPLGDQSGYINHRAKTSENSVTVNIQNDYAFVRITQGNSGTGFFMGENEYVSTLYGGHLGTELFGRNYDTENYNYFGINWNNEDPLSLKNNRSFASMIIRANAQNPNLYDLPWFLKSAKSNN
ncbi:hypothetical protein NX772_03605 [Mesomycoplasma molare]|uniref:DUF31 domain-containing protein n=2 Tax=Mesomycoplasma molare TaxID=171288 RepID=A0ABY5TTZ9_9BACT|nr:hypothetical protein [Mesomycoplasma molare]UWD34145.1 hypothetical protein NX772_03605 [Mesomycoplasma molare]